jgi:formylglycine-generating enzyme required for sulfatase activity
MFDARGGSVQATISKEFYMCDHAVTQKEWVAEMGRNPSFFKGGNLPVESVTWYEAVEYCNKRSEREGLTPAYTIEEPPADKNDDKLEWVVTWNKKADGYRLPTEAEWEFAAHGGVQTKGFKYAGDADVNAVAWYKDNSGGKTHPVMTKKSNELGLYDMSGNVWEWCWDRLKLYKRRSGTDSTAGYWAVVCVNRGGSWNDGSADVRAALRSFGAPSDRDRGRGFRVVHD